MSAIIKGPGGRTLYKTETGYSSVKPKEYLLVVPYRKDQAVYDKKQGELVAINENKKGSVPSIVAKARKQMPGVFYTEPVRLRRPMTMTDAQWKKYVNNKANSIVDEMQTDYDDQAGEDSFTFYSRKGMGVILLAAGNVSSKMKARGAFKYSGAGIYSVADDGKCVITTLQKIYGFPESKILKGLGVENDDDGIEPEQVLKFCKLYNISCVGVDGFGKPLVSFIATQRHRKPLYFVSRDNHFYLMDTAKTKYYQKKRGNSFAKESNQTEKTELPIIFSDEIPDWNAKNHFIVSSYAVVKDWVSNYISTTNNVPHIHVGATEADSIYVKGFHDENLRVSVNPQWKIVEEIQEQTKLKANVVSDISSALAQKHLPNLPKSSLNHFMFDMFKKYHPTQHYAQLFKEEEYDNLQAWDVNKQYTAILRNSAYPWYIMNAFSMPEPFDGIVKDGFYIIKTENICPCKGDGLYSRAIIDYLTQNDIPFTITHQILPSSTLPSTYFQEFIDSVMTELPSKFKYVINTFIGLLNKNTQKQTSLKAFKNQADVFVDIWNNKTNYMEIDVDAETKVYVSAHIKTKKLFKNNMPMNCQILDLAAIQLAEGMKHLKQKGAVIVKYKADSITFSHPDKLKIDLSVSALGGWKIEKVKLNENVSLPNIKKMDLVMPINKWLIEINEGDMDLVEFLSKNSAMLNGPAGFGKSYLLNKVIEKVGVDKCLACSFTNMEANNIDGSTFHKLFKIKITDTEGSYDAERIFEDKEILIVDEISMIPEWLYSKIEAAKLLGLRVICAGDFSQLTPVSASSSAENSLLLKMLCENKVNLTQYKRGSSELLSALTSVRERKSVPFLKGEHGQLHFVFTQYMRDKINKKYMGNKGWETGVESVPRVYNGLPLRCCVSKEDGSMLNGERFVVKCDNLKDDFEIHSLTRENVQVIEKDDLKDFLPAYAITVHASQGLTISEPYTIWIQEQTQFSEDDVWRLIYTATSRAKSFDQIKIQHC
jgi:hypothetical protein